MKTDEKNIMISINDILKLDINSLDKKVFLINQIIQNESNENEKSRLV